jgi:hypothetical protein
MTWVLSCAAGVALFLAVVTLLGFHERRTRRPRFWRLD